MNTNTPVVPDTQAPKKFSYYALSSSISGALTWLLIFFYRLIDMSLIWAAILAPLAAIVAVITGHKGIREIRKAEGSMSGKKLANTGLILGYLYLGICILLVVLLVLGVAGIANWVSTIE